jgi:chromosomal replication initiator protein
MLLFGHGLWSRYIFSIMQTGLLFDFEDSPSFGEFMKLLEDGIKQSLGESIFFAWFSTLSFKSYDGNTLLLTVKNEKIKNCIFLHYQIKFERILEKAFFKHFKKRLKKFEILVLESKEEVASSKLNSNFITLEAFDEKPTFNMGILLEKKFTFQNFLESEENRLPVGLARHFADLIINSSENVFQIAKHFFISGSIGNGKTHLAQAIGHLVKEMGLRVLYTTAERFLFNFQTAIKKNQSIEFLKSFLGIKLLIIDDIHFVATKKKTMDEIKRVAYSIISDGGFVLFCSSGLPSSLPIESGDVKNFLLSSHLIKIENPTESFRYEILKFKVQKSSYKISDSVIKILATKIQTNIRELEGAMGRMVLHSQILNHEIDPEATKFVTTDIFPHKELKKFSITEIQTKVSSHFGISFEELNSKKRVKSILKARQIGIYIASKLTTASYIEIGKCFKRTHSTVIHSIRAIEKEMLLSKSFKNEIEMIKVCLEQCM